MKNSIKNLKVVFSATEKLSTNELCLVKGGGEDLRRSPTVATTSTTTATTSARIAVAAKI